jgi:hypothetical protein
MPLERPIKFSSLPILEWTNANGTHAYQITPEDRLILIRSVWREGRPQTAVAFTLLQRFTYIYPTYRTLADFIKTYSQPINPRWFPAGDKHLSTIAALKTEKQTQEVKAKIAELEARARLRPVYASTPEREIPKAIIGLVDNVLAGNIKSPVPTAVHFRGSSAMSSDNQQTAKKKAESYSQKGNFGEVVPISAGYGQGVNWFFTGENRDQKLFAIRTSIKTFPLAIQRNRMDRWSLPIALFAFGFAFAWLSNE